ncbi:MAG: ABC transporter ATP-binding protein [Gammaproteobacteria bacterium]
MLAPTLEAVDIAKTFVSGSIRTSALNRSSLSFAAGELTLIAGPSGCGKSTLLSILSGLLRPDGGNVRSLGVAFESCTLNELDRFRLRHTGFVFQGFNLFPSLSALEQVLLPLQYLRLPKREARKRAESALEEVGLAARAASMPADLSGGEKQRVAIARAVAKNPELLFADEPTSALDATNGQIAIDLLHRAARTQGATVVCVSHDPRLERHADRVLQMEDGRVREAAP